MTARLLLSIALLLPCGFAAAQQMYRCGNTFSQTPCGPDAAARTLPSASAPEGASGPSGYELCAVAARRLHGGPEPETARIERVGDRRSEVIQFSGQPLAAQRYDLSIDARTTNGVFSGPRLFGCWLSEDQRRVLQLQPAPR